MSATLAVSTFLEGAPQAALLRAQMVSQETLNLVREFLRERNLSIDQFEAMVVSHNGDEGAAVDSLLQLPVVPPEARPAFPPAAGLSGSSGEGTASASSPAADSDQKKGFRRFLESLGLLMSENIPIDVIPSPMASPDQPPPPPPSQPAPRPPSSEPSQPPPPINAVEQQQRSKSRAMEELKPMFDKSGLPPCLFDEVLGQVGGDVDLAHLQLLDMLTSFGDMETPKTIEKEMEPVNPFLVDFSAEVPLLDEEDPFSFVDSRSSTPNSPRPSAAPSSSTPKVRPPGWRDYNKLGPDRIPDPKLVVLRSKEELANQLIQIAAGVGDEDPPEGTHFSPSKTVIIEEEQVRLRSYSGEVESLSWTRNAGVGPFYFTVEIRDDANNRWEYPMLEEDEITILVDSEAGQVDSYILPRDRGTRECVLDFRTPGHYEVRVFLAGQEIQSSPFSLDVGIGKGSPFPEKRTVFFEELNQYRGEHAGDRVELHVDRFNLLPSCLRAIGGLSKEDALRPIRVIFDGEEGVDVGGVKRELISLLSEQLFNPDFLLFLHCDGGSGICYQPNPLSFLQQSHIQYFRLAGRVCALAILWECTMNIHLTQSMYKFLMGEKLVLSDLEVVDLVLFNSLKYILETEEIEDIFPGQRFVVEREMFGDQLEEELIPNGDLVELDRDNRSIYVMARAIDRLQDSVKDQLVAFRDAFLELIPLDMLRMLSAVDLDLIICGVPELDPEDWERNTNLREFSPSDKEVKWFFEIVRDIPNEQRAKILLFCTGSPCPPAGGFAMLIGSSGSLRKFELYSAGGQIAKNGLPNAHTCFNQLVLPKYSSKRVMKQRLLTTIEMGMHGFAQA